MTEPADARVTIPPAAAPRRASGLLARTGTPLMSGSSGDQLQEPGRGRHGRRVMEAFASPDSYGMVLILILLTYVLSATLTAPWAASLVLAVQIATLWVTLRASRARRSVRTVVNVALAVVAVTAVANLVFVDQLQHGRLVSWISCLLYLAAPLSILRHLVLRRVVDSETMLGAIAAYLMVGMFFAFLYHALGFSQAQPPFFGAQGDGTFSQDSVLLIHHAHHHRVRQPGPGREPGPDLCRARDADRSAVPGHGGGQGRQCLATGPGQGRTARELRRRVTVSLPGRPSLALPRCRLLQVACRGLHLADRRHDRRDRAQ